MRLIDADELKKALTNKDLITWTHEYGDAIPVDWLMSIIDNAPTVERPQGEWLPNYTSQFMNPGKQCSLCGKIVEFSENYCPKCGAEMRGKKE